VKRLEATRVPLSGQVLIEASAGTGKTHTITTLFLRLLLEREIDVGGILVVTFTNAATAELRRRVRERLVQAERSIGTGESDDEVREIVLGVGADKSRRLLREALREFDRASISTIHGFCQKALADFAFESKLAFQRELVVDPRAMLRDLVVDFWTRELDAATPAQVAYLSRSGVRLDSMLRLADRVSSSPALVVLPEVTAEEGRAEVDAYLAERDRTREIWLETREAVADLLLSASLNRRSYSEEKIEDWLGEIHAFFARTAPTLEGFAEGIERFCQDTLNRNTTGGTRPPTHALFQAFERLSAARTRASEVLEVWAIAFQQRLVQAVRTELPRRKQAQGLMTFDDLLQELAQGLEGPDGEKLARRLGERYPAILVDEFQDTDPVQYRIFRRIRAADAGLLVLIGDPKQAIYRFRGADVYSYLEAARDAGDNRWTLGVNHRSDPALVAAINMLFERPHAVFATEGIDFFPVKPRPGKKDVFTRAGRPAAPFEIAFIEHESSVAMGKTRITKRWSGLTGRVAAHIARLLGSNHKLQGRELGPGDFAVLTRTNQQAYDVQTALAELGVPAVLLGDRSVLESDEAVELAIVMNALSKPTSERALITALTTSLFGRTISQTAALRDDEPSWERWIESFTRWHVLWERHGFMRAFRTLLRDDDVVRRLLSLVGGERRLTNVLHLAELLHSVESAEKLGIPGLCRWFEDARRDLGVRGGVAKEEHQLRLESDATAVKITTMHQSKGLEYPIVICTHLWDGGGVRDYEPIRFHDPDDAYREKLILTKDKAAREKVLADEEAHAEDMRLAYVALTRARHALTTAWGCFSGAETSPLGKLLHAPLVGPALASSSLARKDLTRLTDASPSFTVSDLAETPGPRYRPASPVSPVLSARELRRKVELRWRVSSFSALAAHGAPLSLPQEVGRDVDENTTDALERPGQEPEATVALHAFPRGASAGDALHEILEHVDFARMDAPEARDITEKALARHAIDPGLAPLVTSALGRALDTPLAGDLRLSRVRKESRLAELEFAFPVQTDGRAITAEDLVNAFASDGAGVDPTYLPRLATLEFAPLRGFLRGFIDLVFEADGRFWVVDYKSNFLGTTASDYVRTRMARAMAEHHYYLQYHLYSLAVDRYLATRIPDYDYERDFGGVFYLFLRGMDPAHPAGTGVFADRPPRKRMLALHRLFQKGAER
jgi:exodeoxyribonuclease V beta subunit